MRRSLVIVWLGAAVCGCAEAETEPDADVAVDDGTAETDGPADADPDVDAVDEDAAAETDEDAAPDVDEDAGAEATETGEDAAGDADGDGDAPPDGSDPCSPNPCTDPPIGTCDADGTTLHGSADPGTCTPDGSGGYGCTYTPADINCSSDGRVCLSGGVCSYTLASLRAAADGTLTPARNVRDLFVTYVRPAGAADNGFYAQEAPAGPGLFFPTGTAAPTAAAGNTISVTIDRVGSFHGRKEAASFTIDENDRLTPSVAPWVQNLSAGGAVDESTESELLRVAGATLDGGAGSTWTIAYGASGATTVVYAGFDSLIPAPCVGMVLDVQAPAGEYDGLYELTAFADGDFSALDASGCPADDDSNWDFEDWGLSVDPPADFLKTPTTLFTATRSTTRVQDGAGACTTTWTTTVNRDLIQTWYTPADPGVVYTHHVWIWDDDPAGRTRSGLQFYDATGTALGLWAYATGYTADAAGWVEFTLSGTSPAGTASVRALLRFYDVGTFTTATLTIDDWALTEPIAFNPTNGVLEAWTTTAPAAPRLFRDPVTPTMDAWAALNDAGVLYAATNEVHGGWSDHLLYVWVGAPSTTATVAAPWSKAGTVAGPGTEPGAALFALVQEESNGYAEVLRWGGSAWSAVGAPASAAGYDGTTDGTGIVEATVDLVTALSLADASAIPGALGFSVAPYGTADGGALDASNQYPHPTTHVDGNVDAGEVLGLRRSSILVGNAR